MKYSIIILPLILACGGKVDTTTTIHNDAGCWSIDNQPWVCQPTNQNTHCGWECTNMGWANTCTDELVAQCHPETNSLCPPASQYCNDGGVLNQPPQVCQRYYTYCQMPSWTIWPDQDCNDQLSAKEAGLIVFDNSCDYDGWGEDAGKHNKHYDAGTIQKRGYCVIGYENVACQ